MVEVIQNGKDKEYEVQCRGCNSLLRYKENDTYLKEVVENKFAYEYKVLKTIVKVKTYTHKNRVITCPICKNDIPVGTPFKFLFPIKTGERLATKEEIKQKKILY